MRVSFKGGGDFEKVRKSFEKMRATTVKSEGALYQKRKEMDIKSFRNIRWGYF